MNASPNAKPSRSSRVMIRWCTAIINRWHPTLVSDYRFAASSPSSAPVGLTAIVFCPYLLGDLSHEMGLVKPNVTCEM